MSSSDMRIHKGIPVSPGIAIAPIIAISTEDAVPIFRPIGEEEVGVECKRFDGAVEQASGEIDRTIQRFPLFILA